MKLSGAIADRYRVDADPIRSERRIELLLVVLAGLLVIQGLFLAVRLAIGVSPEPTQARAKAPVSSSPVITCGSLTMFASFSVRSFVSIVLMGKPPIFFVCMNLLMSNAFLFFDRFSRLELTRFQLTVLG